MKAMILAPMGSVHRRFNSVNIKALQNLNYEVHLLANFSQGEGTEQQNLEYVEVCEKAGIHVHSLNFERHSIKSCMANARNTRALIDQFGFDLVHAHTETGGLILRLAGHRKNSRYLYTPHGMSIYKGSSLKSQIMYRPVEKWICTGMDDNLAINVEEYDLLKRWNSQTAHLVHGIGLKIDRFQGCRNRREQIRSELGIPLDAKVVLSIGELDDNKNHITVIEAIKSIPNVYYLICGVGPNKGKLEKAGLGNRLILAGYRKDIPEVIGASDIFAFPSFHEGLPVSLMEAMAGGLPVVCSGIRGNVDLIKDGQNGFLADPRDSSIWATFFRKMIQDDDLCKSFVLKNLRIIENYSEEAVFRELRSIYSKKKEES